MMSASQMISSDRVNERRTRLIERLAKFSERPRGPSDVPEIKSASQNRGTWKDSLSAAACR